MDQSNRAVNASSEMRVSKPQTVVERPPEHRKKSPDDLIVQDSSMIFGVDRNIVIMVAIAGISIGLSLYLFREIKKIKEEVKLVKTQGPDDDLIDKVEQNSEAVKAIETKLDQLIMALGARERAMRSQQPQQSQMSQQSQPQQSQPQQMMQQPPQSQPQQMMQPPPVREQEYQNQQMEHMQSQQQIQQQQMQQQQMQQQMQQSQQPIQISGNSIPVMGGRLQGSAVSIEEPGIITI